MVVIFSNEYSIAGKFRKFSLRIFKGAADNRLHFMSKQSTKDFSMKSHLPTNWRKFSHLKDSRHMVHLYVMQHLQWLV